LQESAKKHSQNRFSFSELFGVAKNAGPVLHDVQTVAVSEPNIKVRNREALVYLVTEAAEVDHNLMCCYLFAAFSLKTEVDGLTADVAAEIATWKRRWSILFRSEKMDR
jgi:hypothetical protein